MKRQRWQAFLIIGILVLGGCQSVEPPPSLDNVDVNFIRGSIGANLMPIVPPDPIMCELVLVARNRSGESYSGLSVPGGEAFLGNDSTRLGQIEFANNWDGRLGPFEVDTIRLRKISAPTSSFLTPCGRTVFLRLSLMQTPLVIRQVVTEPMTFFCVY
jgi:hypothetical protein